MKKTTLLGIAFLFILCSFITYVNMSLATITGSSVSLDAASQTDKTKVSVTASSAVTPVSTSAATTVSSPSVTSSNSTQNQTDSPATVSAANTTTMKATTTSASAAKTIVAPPVYIETHQTQTQTQTTSLGEDTAIRNQNNEAGNWSSTDNVSAPPKIIPKEIPANQGEVTRDFVVTSIVVTETKIDPKTSKTTSKVIEFQGHAKPNTYITLYIYSTPIIVTVKTDSQGNWKYNLDQELEDGKHQVYVAQIDNTGNVVAKSDPILFTKAAASVQFASSDALPVAPPKVNFFQQYFIVVALGILVLAILISLTVIGLVGRKSTELPPELPGPSDAPIEPTQPSHNIQQ